MRGQGHTQPRGAGGLRQLVLVVLLVLAAGCRVDIAVDVALDREGAGELALALRADAALQEHARRAGVDPLSHFAETGQALAAGGWRLADSEGPDGGRQVRLSAPFANPAEFNILAADLARSLSAPEVRLLEDLRLAVDDDEIVVSGGAGLQPTGVVAELGLDPEEAVALARSEDAVGYELHVTMPGEVLETTADEVEGPALTWRVAPGEQVSLLAVGARPAPPLWPLAVGGLAGMGVAAALIGLYRRRS